MITITEAQVEQATLDWLKGLGWQVAHGPDIAPETRNAERDGYGQVVLERRLRDALAELNPGLPTSALVDVFCKLTRPEGSTLEARNRAFHRMLVDGVTVEHRGSEGRNGGAHVQVIDFDNPAPTTGWPSTSSPSPRIGTLAGRMLCCSSTVCLWVSSS